MTVKKKENKNALNVKLKDRLDYLDKSIFYDTKTENPVEKLSFNDTKKINKISILSQLNFKEISLFLLIVVLLSSSIVLNGTLVNKFDPQVYKLFSSVSGLLKNGVDLKKNIFVDCFTKPYVVTVGEYGNFAIAKEEAIKLLPKLRQVDIKKLKSGIYTFQISRFVSKKSAYLLADDFMRDGFDAVHVRYLLDQ